MDRPNVLVIGAPDHGALRHLAALREMAEISASADPGELERLLPTAEIIVFGMGWQSLDLPGLWKHARAVRWVHSLSAGLDGVLFPALARSSTPLTNARGVFKRPLAEFALLGMLFHFKRVRRLIENQRARQWHEVCVSLLEGRVVGVVGYGEIGRECALLAHGAGMRIQALRRHPERSSRDDILERIYGPERLLEMLGGIEVLVCAAPLTRDTRHLLGAREFEAMQPGALVVNVGRGAVIDEAELVRALVNKRIAGAALDVFEQEPLPRDSPLWGMENVLVSPHCADRTADPDWIELTVQCFIRNFHRYRSGEPLLNLVDKRAGY